MGTQRYKTIALAVNKDRESTDHTGMDMRDNSRTMEPSAEGSDPWSGRMPG